MLSVVVDATSATSDELGDALTSVDEPLSATGGATFTLLSTVIATLAVEVAPVLSVTMAVTV